MQCLALNKLLLSLGLLSLHLEGIERVWLAIYVRRAILRSLLLWRWTLVKERVLGLGYLLDLIDLLGFHMPCWDLLWLLGCRLMVNLHSLGRLLDLQDSFLIIVDFRNLNFGGSLMCLNLRQGGLLVLSLLQDNLLAFWMRAETLLIIVVLMILDVFNNLFTGVQINYARIRSSS